LIVSATNLFADLNPAIGSEIEKVRPVVIISQDEMNKYWKPSWYVHLLQVASTVEDAIQSNAQNDAELRLTRSAHQQAAIEKKIDTLSDIKAAQLRNHHRYVR